MKEKVDAIIVGSGPVGMLTALALSQDGCSVALLDHVALETTLDPAFDGRTFAISLGSSQILESLDAWQGLIPFAQAILDIHVSQKSPDAFVHYGPSESGGLPMGYMLEARHLRQALLRACHSAPNIHMHAPVTWTDITQDATSVTLHLEGEQTFTAPLLIAADGRGSKVREQTSLKVRTRPYDQTALVGVVEITRPHNGIAFEHFLPRGPLAFLPMQGLRCAFVWSAETAFAAHLKTLSMEDLSAEMMHAFGDALGELSVQGALWSYPLARAQSSHFFEGRIALVGDAAHVMHPVAGQGLNLGIRDVAALSTALKGARQVGLDIGAETTLRQYANARKIDTFSLLATTDGLVRLFSNHSKTLAPLRGLGLKLTERCAPLKKLLARQAMGLGLVDR